MEMDMYKNKVVNMDSGSVILNDELTVRLPKGFYIMEEEEGLEYRAYERMALVIRDPDTKAIFSVTWKEAPGLSALLISPKNVMKKMEKHLAGSKEDDYYKLEGFLKSKIAGKEAIGYRSDFRSENWNITVDNRCIKNQKIFYYFYAYMLTDRKNECVKKYEEFLDTIKIGTSEN